MPDFVKPFAALRPEAEHAMAVVAPPYDVVSTEEARRLVSGQPNSFLHVSRPEIGLPQGTDPCSDVVHAKAAENFDRLRALGLVTRDDAPGYYAYRMQMGEHRQTGIAATVSADAYQANRFRKHELTRPDKETDRVRNMLALKAQTGPVLSAYRARNDLRALIDEVTARPALFEVAGQHDVEHTVWRIAAPEQVGAVTAAFNGMDALYIADGHHRSAAGARVAEELRGSDDWGTKSSDYILTVAFPHDELRILGYNRVVADLNGLSAADLLGRLADSLEVEPAPEAVTPERPATFGLFLDGRWYRLTICAEHQSGDDPRASMPDGDPVARQTDSDSASSRSGLPADPVASLDVSLLHDRVLGPILNVGDPRTDPRVDFVGGIRGPQELERRVRDGRAAAAFSLFPTRMEQLMAVADADRLMPPKSTWFEPKLADGLLTHVLD